MRSQPVIGLGQIALFGGAALPRVTLSGRPRAGLPGARPWHPGDCVRGHRVTAAQGQEQRPAVAERPGDRECGLPLGRRSRGSGRGIRARSGHQVWGSSALSQVTGLAPAAELDRRAKLDELDAYLADLDNELGPVPQHELRAAQEWADAILPADRDGTGQARSA